MPDPGMMNDRLMGAVIEDVMAERWRQFEKWGDQAHGMPVWLAIIGEEFGELCEAMLRARTWNQPREAIGKEGGMAELQRALADTREEALQLAASAVALIEAIDDGRADVGCYAEGDISGDARP